MSTLIEMLTRKFQKFVQKHFLRILPSTKILIRISQSSLDMMFIVHDKSPLPTRTIQTKFEQIIILSALGIRNLRHTTINTPDFNK